MKKLAKLLAIVMIITSLSSVAVFAESDVTIKDRVEQLMEEGYSREEIKATLEAEGFTITGKGDRGEKPELTEEEKAQMEETKARYEELKAEGLSREEIHETLEAEGYTLPNKGPRGDKPELTEEQKVQMEALKTRVEELKAEGLSREEIKEALEAEGFEFPERGPRGDKPELTEEQKAQMEAIKSRVEELKAEGLSREEIKETLEAEGFELPAKIQRVEKPELTDEQKAELETIKAKIEEFKANGLSREEIKEALEAEGFEMKMPKPMGGRK